MDTETKDLLKSLIWELKELNLNLKESKKATAPNPAEIGKQVLESFEVIKKGMSNNGSGGA